LASKEDVIEVINNAFATLGINEQVDESVFYKLVQNNTTSTMYPQWNDVVRFLEQ